MPLSGHGRLRVPAGEVLIAVEGGSCFLWV